MKDGFFWRTVAVLAIASVAYVGHGLHGPLPPLTESTNANGVSISPLAKEGTFTVTASPDGKSVHYFGPKGFAFLFKNEAYLGTLTAP